MFCPGFVGITELPVHDFDLLQNFFCTVLIEYCFIAKNLVKSFFKFNILFLQTVMAIDSTPTVVPPPTPVMAPMTVSHGEKLEKFNGTKFKR